MVEAGFNGVFLGIETPNPKALAITKKPQNISTREPDQLKPLPHVHPSLRMHKVYPALMMVRGRLSPGQIPAYSRFIAKVSKDHPAMLAEAIRLAALGYHFREVHPLQTILSSCPLVRVVGSVRTGRQFRDGDGRDRRFIGQQRRIEEVVIQHYGCVQQTLGVSHRRPVRRPRRDRPGSDVHRPSVRGWLPRPEPRWPPRATG